MSEQLALKGMFRIHLEEDGQIVGDSGWHTNLIPTAGLNEYVMEVMAGDAGSKTISHVALGTGGAPTAGSTTLAGEITHASNSRKAATLATSDRTLQITATFASSDAHNTASANISNIGLFQQSNTNTATIFAGNTYTSSSWATNQNVNITYNIVYASST